METNIVAYIVSPFPEMRELLSSALEALAVDGYCCECRLFGDPQEVITAMKSANHKPDLLITSFKCPGTSRDNLWLLQAGKEIHPPLKVVLASCYLSGRDRRAVKKSPVRADGIVMLPFVETTGFETLLNALAPLKISRASRQIARSN